MTLYTDTENFYSDFEKKKFDKEHLIYNKMFSAQKIEVEIKTS